MKIRNKFYVFGKKIITGIQIATFASAIVFAASCNNETKETEKKDPCMCDPKEHNEGDDCCIGDGCMCKIILKCDCPTGTLHEDKSKECRGPLNCNCEDAYAKLVNGIFVTMDNAVVDKAGVMNKIDTAFEWLDYTENEATIIKNNVYAIRVVLGHGATTKIVLENGKCVLIIDNISDNDLYNDLYDLATEIGGV